MKFIHTADIHWGMHPDSDKPWSRERAHAIHDTFGEIVRQAKVRDVDFLFIAGDLFHRQPLLRDLKEVNYLFSTIPGVRVVIIAGNHEPHPEKLCSHELSVVSQCNLSYGAKS